MSLTRRDALKALAITAAGGTLMSRSAFAAATSATESALMPGADVCVITPQVTDGPFYFDPALERSDITEGEAGVPTTVRLQVVDATCQPLAGARVDIWHCNAAGVYSGYPNQTAGADATGQTFLRGTQFTGTDGIVAFETIYPGWYAGRTTHIHFKVFIEENQVLTGQLFFPDALSQFLDETVEPYKTRGSERDILNANDRIAAQATRASFAYVKELADRYLVAMIIGVDPNGPATAGLLPAAAGGPPPEGSFGSGEGAMSFPATEPSVSLVPGTKGIR